jgi:hypothetical protein
MNLLVWAPIASICLGLWLTVAPSVIGYGGLAAKNDQAMGPLVVTFAILSLSQVIRACRVANLIVAGWLLVSPAVLDHGRGVDLHSVGVAIAIGALSLVRTPSRLQQGGGWRALKSDPR